MNAVIYVVSKNPVSTKYIPSSLKGPAPLISQYEVINRTAKGYRLKLYYARDKGVMYLDKHYSFFENYAEALEYIAAEASSVAGALEEMKLKDIRLMCEAHDELGRSALNDQ